MDPGTAKQRSDASGSIEKISIASQYTHCEISFYKLLQALETLNDQAVTQRLLDEFGRFRVWAGNAGAHRTGRVSLDYRLREASHIHKKLMKFLQELNTYLEKGAFEISSLQGAFIVDSRPA